MNAEPIVALLQNLFFSENKPPELKPIDLSLLAYLVLRQSEDHFINDSQLTLAERLGCNRDTVAASIDRLDKLGWIATKEPWQFNEKTKSKSRRIGGTVGLSIVLSKLPQAEDRTKHSPPSSDAVTLASRHNVFLTKIGVSTKRHKNFRSQQEYAAQRIIDRVGSFSEAVDILNFAAKDQRFHKAARRNLYEVRRRLIRIVPAYERHKATRDALAATA